MSQLLPQEMEVATVGLIREYFQVLTGLKLQPGDVVYIDGGSSGLTYTTNLIPTKSGTSGNPITITRGVDSGHNGIPTFTTTTYRSGLI